MSTRVVLLGPPASGKGTQGRKLAETLGLAYLSTGALLRAAVQEGSSLGKQAEPVLARGDYLSDELMCSIMAAWLEDQSGGWVLDGFPRSLPQAVFLDHWLVARGLELDAAVLLEVPFEVLLDRMIARVECPVCRWSGNRSQLGLSSQCPDCGSPAGPRADDNPENFRSRYAEYEEHTLPVVDRYRDLGLLRRFDATRGASEVGAELVAAIQSPNSHGETN